MKTLSLLMNHPPSFTNCNSSDIARQDFDLDTMKNLMSEIASAPTNEEEENAKSDVAIVLWSHLTEAGRRDAWQELHDIRMKAKVWTVQNAY